MSIIKQIRESCGLNTYQLSKATGIPNATVWDIENDRVKAPKVENIEKILNFLSERVEVSYLAGLADRASTINITRTTGAGNHDHYIARFEVRSNHREIPEIFKRVLKTGNVTSYKFYKHHKDGTKSQYINYVYYAHSAQAADAINILFPYLKIKREKAKVLLEFRELMTKNRNKHSEWWWNTINKYLPTPEQEDQESVNAEYKKFYDRIREV